MHDPTEDIRRKKVNEINSNPNERVTLEASYGQVWDTNELQKDFKVIGFSAPFTVVEKKSNGVMGTIEFQHSPRYYYNFKEDE